MNRAEEVLRFWFGEPAGAPRKAWFEKDPVFDAGIRARFLDLHAAAARGTLASWNETPAEALALIVLTDQFPRNMYRGTAAAFATDPVALTSARRVVASGWDPRMLPVERIFVYLPFEHSESLADQERSLELFKPLEAIPESSDNWSYAVRHWEIVKRFGRFPHRNAALGRPSTAEETEFLKQPGSGF